MRVLTTALCALVTVGVLYGCSGSGPSATPNSFSGGSAAPMSKHGNPVLKYAHPASVIPDELRPRGVKPLHGNPPPPGSSGGIYVSEFYSAYVYLFMHGNQGNNPPVCTIGGVSYPNDIASDNPGNVIDPDGSTSNIIVFKGDGQCGSEIGSVNDPYGQPVDASSTNAMKNTIAVANIFSTPEGGGSVALCTMKGGCSTNLINPDFEEVIGVALSQDGDCWADAVTPEDTTELVWFQGCTGSGEQTTGFENTYAGGLDIDNAGNLIALSPYDSTAYVYSGCNPACTVVGGPFTLEGESTYGHLNRQNMTYAAADWENGQVDVYTYKSPNLKYLYSFNNGLDASAEVLGAMQSPRSRQK